MTAIAIAVIQARGQRNLLAETPTEINDRDRRVSFAQEVQRREGIILASVINVNDFASFAQLARTSARRLLNSAIASASL
jgi:hypothetical protein